MIKSRRKRKQIGMSKGAKRRAYRFADAATMHFELFGRYPSYKQATQIDTAYHYTRNQQLK